MLAHFADAFVRLSEFDVMVGLLAGILLGYIVGALPGMTSSMGMALLIPVTFTMDPVASIVMLVAIYMAADYAAAIPAILVNAPGQPAAAVTAFEGYPMRQAGRGGTALALSITSSAIGALISVIFLIFTAEAMVGVALAFGPAEYFALAVFGLSLVAVLSTGSMLATLMGLFFGLTVVTTGIDPSSGTTRYVWTDSMLDGIPFVPAMIGLFALSEVLKLSERRGRAGGNGGDVGDMTVRLPWGTVIENRWNILRSGTIGYIVGVIPGAGSSIASLVSYGIAKRLSARPERFGTGAEEGLIASETANNASVSGALAPMLALGLPGSASSAILIGALTIHGLQPGPLLFQRNPEIPYAIFASLLAGLPLMTVLGLFGGRLWIRLTAIPTPILSATVAAICLVGAYASSNNLYGVTVALIFGVFGYLFRKVGIHPGPVVLALVLGELVETSFRRAVQISGGDYTVFVTSPIALGLLLAALAGLLYPLAVRWAAVGRKQDA